MNDNAFDEALRRVAADEKLPYDEATWERMAARLDAHSSGKKKRALVVSLPMLRWAAAAAVVIVALALGWWLRDAAEPRAAEPAIVVRQAGAGTLPQQSTVTSPTQTGSNEQTSSTQELTAAAGQSRDRARKPALPSGASSSPTTITASPAPDLQEKNPVVAAQQPKELVPPSVQNSNEHSTVVATQPRSTRPTQNWFVDEDEKPETARGMGFDLAGGYGFSSSLSTFTVGVAVKRDVGRRVHFEGGLALLGGAQNTSVTVTETVYQHTPGVTSGVNPEPTVNVTSADSSYTQPGRERLVYLQAAPTVSYRIYKGFSAGGGLDAQRLLGAPSLALAKNEDFAIPSSANVRVAEPVQAEWDFGFALRADYQITKGLRIGIQHRESLRATADGARTAGRSYWLLQAGLRLR